MATNHSLNRDYHTVPKEVTNPRSRPRILFVTENYPKDPYKVEGNTFFYRTQIHPTRDFTLETNILLINFCKALNINYALFNSEAKLLDHFIEKYYVIDSYKHGSAWTPKSSLSCSIEELIEDINDLNPVQLVFCYERSNDVIFNKIFKYLSKNIQVIAPIDKNGNPTNKNVLKSPTGQWFHDQHFTKSNKTIEGFYNQIQLLLKYKYLHL